MAFSSLELQAIYRSFANEKRLRMYGGLPELFESQNSMLLDGEEEDDARDENDVDPALTELAERKRLMPY